VERPVEVTVFDRGELQSVRVLSPGRERWAALLAAATGATLVLGAMAAAAGVVTGFELVVHAPTFFLAWLGVAAVVGYVSARWVRARLARYRLGADIEADAFAMADVELVRRAGQDYELGLCPGMSGTIEHRHSSVPLEAFIRPGPTYLPLPPQGKVRVEIGHITFVISRRPAPEGRPFPLKEWMLWLATGPIRRLTRSAALGVPVALLATFFGSVPAVYAMTELDTRWSIPADATPAVAQKLIQAKAQFQTSTLHQCFDPLPLSCQRPGYVGVGVSLSKDGEVKSHWISRSTYDEDCPVTSCMENVVAHWTFEPMPERMNVIIPIQVKRTRRPLLPPENVMLVTPVYDGGDGCRDSSGASGVPSSEILDPF
jgi:hypothetical protein